MGNNQWAIFKTLLYSDLFQFPLTEKEIWYYLASSHPVSPETLHEELRRLREHVVTNHGLYALREHEQYIVERQAKEVHSEKKIAIARLTATYLSLIPSIIFIGVSGSVAVGNAKKEDDIDLFIITERGTMFISRLLAVILLQLMRKRRRRNESSPSDKVCLNFFLDENKLQFHKSFHDLYTARELVQVYPLFERGDAYRELLRRNSWTRIFLPNAKGRNVPFRHKKLSCAASWLRIAEPLARIPQKLLIYRHQSREIVTNEILAFHPLATRETILANYQKRLRQYSKYYNT